jgi:DNA-binding transcriptional LysR family regulator
MTLHSVRAHETQDHALICSPSRHSPAFFSIDTSPRQPDFGCEIIVDLRHLSTFVAIAEELNFHRAAERLTMAQPAVSRIVLELEDRLCVKLLERTTRKVSLTESGRYLLEEAQEILGRIDIAENTVRLLASGTKAILQIGYTAITGHSPVPDIMREFRIANPDVRLELAYMTNPAQRDRILQDDIDFGFIEGSFQSSEIESVPVARHRLVALLSPNHPLAAKDALTIEELASEQHGHQCRVADAAPHRCRYFSEGGTGHERRTGSVKPYRHPRPGNGWRRDNRVLRHAAILRRECDRRAADHHRSAGRRRNPSGVAAHQH